VERDRSIIARSSLRKVMERIKNNNFGLGEIDKWKRKIHKDKFMDSRIEDISS
jgi:hypothetical protein